MSAQPMTVLPPVTPKMSFHEASELVLEHLRTLIPLGFWSVSYYDVQRNRQIYAHLRDDVYGLEQGGSHSWSDSFCQFSVMGDGPQIAPDAMAVPQYASAGVTRAIDIGAYVGVPIHSGGGRLYGTLCGLDPQVQSASLYEHAPALRLIAEVLGQILTRERLEAEAEAREAALGWRSLHDMLTGLPNRTFFKDRLVSGLGLRQADFRPLAVLALDVDDFAAVNDTFGRAGGDELLVAVADRLRLVLPASDTIAHVSGDEFAVMVERDDLDEYRPPPAVVAERLVAALSEPFAVAGEPLSITVSVGVAHVEQNDSSFSAPSLLARADLALHAAKRAGKGRVVVHQSTVRGPESRDLRLREPLRNAIRAGLVTAAYQPIVDLQTLTATSVECLARWEHAGVAVSPEVFVALADRSSMTGELTDLIVDRACQPMAAWTREPGREHLRVAVNVSPTLIGDPDFPLRTAALLERHGLDPGRLTLEITEDALVGDRTDVQRVCDELCAMGVTLSLDDFGTGHSSLLDLRRVTLDSLKIDRRFTRNVDSSPASRRFVQALVALGHDLGLRVIAEGVERAPQAEVLLELGATHGQGYLYGRPAPADELRL